MLSPIDRLTIIYENLQQFSRPFWTLISGSFINRAGEFIMPFIALYLTSERHFTISEATLAISLMGLGSLMAGICGGMMADFLGRRVTILVSLFSSAGLMLALGLAGSLPLIIALAILYELFSNLSLPATTAAVADMAPRGKLSETYSLHYWANNVGSAIGPVIAGVLAPISYPLLFLGDSLTTFLFGIMVWFGVPETRLPRKAKAEASREEPLHLLHALKDPWLWSYSLLGLLFEAVYFQHVTTLPLDMLAHGLNPLAYGSVMALNAVLAVAVSLPLTSFFNRRSLNTSVAIAAICLGVGMSIFSWWTSYFGYLVGVLIWTLGEILYDPISNALITDIAPKHLRGTYQGIFQTVRSGALVIGPVLGGFALQSLGSAIFWQCCFVVGLFVAAGCFVLGRIRRTFNARLPLATLPIEATAGE
ncbi:MDR family MFS transporter [Ktedonospora formicarum]|uniref:MFS transporter n=1 Tax=Ktedonospora formicarum TaxID=2778364 RepID=A0A8J3I8F7_9CHLR|nr:MFS transporter [Ktedonospora formicarum]GHO47947.1 MFS transporter [Ktedonospora formicarum]